MLRTGFGWLSAWLSAISESLWNAAKSWQSANSFSGDGSRPDIVQVNSGELFRRLRSIENRRLSRQWPTSVPPLAGTPGLGD